MSTVAFCWWDRALRGPTDGRKAGCLMWGEIEVWGEIRSPVLAAPSSDNFRGLIASTTDQINWSESQQDSRDARKGTQRSLQGVRATS